MTNFFGTTTSGAAFSPCRTWRYSLWRNWSVGEPEKIIAFIGLNPSTADEIESDPTVTRCIRRAQRLGFYGMFMLNAYAYRATDPADMKAFHSPIGEDNMAALTDVGRRVGCVVAAWGVHCDPAHGMRICEAINREIHCLGRTKDGRPRHPLYLKNDAPLVPFWKPGIGKVVK